MFPKPKRPDIRWLQNHRSFKVKTVYGRDYYSTSSLTILSASNAYQFYEPLDIQSVTQILNAIIV
jgi:hypothetical protein